MAKKSIYELAQEFPNKTYTELEKYRDADRQEEAQRIITQQENEELKDNQLTESQRRQEELEPIETDQVKEAQARSAYLQEELDRVKRENKDLHDRVNALLDSDAALRKVRESGL
jgi:predicted nuclease with TOPRIM domain